MEMEFLINCPDFEFFCLLDLVLCDVKGTVAPPWSVIFCYKQLSSICFYVDTRYSLSIDVILMGKL